MLDSVIQFKQKFAELLKTKKEKNNELTETIPNDTTHLQCKLL